MLPSRRGCVKPSPHAMRVHYGLSVLQETHGLRTPGLRRRTRPRGRFINHLKGVRLKGKVAHQPLNPHTPYYLELSRRGGNQEYST